MLHPKVSPPPSASWVKGNIRGSASSVLIFVCLALRVCQQSVCGLVTRQVGRGEAPRPPSLPLWVPGRLLLLNDPWCARWSLSSPHHSWGNQQAKRLGDLPGVTQLRSRGSQVWVHAPNHCTVLPCQRGLSFCGSFSGSWIIPWSTSPALFSTSPSLRFKEQRVPLWARLPQGRGRRCQGHPASTIAPIPLQTCTAASNDLALEDAPGLT